MYIKKWDHCPYCSYSPWGPRDRDYYYPCNCERCRRLRREGMKDPLGDSRSGNLYCRSYKDKIDCVQSVKIDIGNPFKDRINCVQLNNQNCNTSNYFYDNSSSQHHASQHHTDCECHNCECNCDCSECVPCECDSDETSASKTTAEEILQKIKNIEEAMANGSGSQGVKGDKGDIGPKGEKGDKGDKGDTGAVGPAGAVGAQGPGGGATGPKGDKGDPGAQGIKGDKGDVGATGPKGDKGDQGDPGSAGVTGPKGDKGDTGATGANGAAGATGAPGKSAYQIAVENGFTGTEPQFNALLNSLISGSTTPTGPTGTTGPTEPTTQTDEWDMTYIYNGPSSFSNYYIALEDFTGWNGTQILDDSIYDTQANADKYQLWANNPGDGSTASPTFNQATASLIPFDGFGTNPEVAGAIKEWGYDSGAGPNGSIYITGSTPGVKIPMKLMRLE